MGGCKDRHKRARGPRGTVNVREGDAAGIELMDREGPGHAGTDPCLRQVGPDTSESEVARVHGGRMPYLQDVSQVRADWNPPPGLARAVGPRNTPSVIHSALSALGSRLKNTCRPGTGPKRATSALVEGNRRNPDTLPRCAIRVAF